MDIQLAIPVIRKSKRLTQVQLAARIGISQTYLSLIENRKRRCTLETIEKIYDALDCDLGVVPRNRLIVSNPMIQFGHPTIKGTRITVDNIYGHYLGGDSVLMISRLYDLSIEQVEACIEYIECSIK